MLRFSDNFITEKEVVKRHVSFVLHDSSKTSPARCASRRRRNRGFGKRFRHSGGFLPSFLLPRASWLAGLWFGLNASIEVTRAE
jgi:hypothetical protein